mgnify:FL=1
MHDTVSLGLHKLFSITATSTVSRVLVIGLNGLISKEGRSNDYEKAE